MTHTLLGSELKIVIFENDYSEEVIYKCFYWYTGKNSIYITRQNASFLVSISLNPEQLSDGLVEPLILKIKQDLIDFKLRNIVAAETKVIRELIVAKAFAHFDSIEDPKTEISDPVGFNPYKL